jgi:3-phosphoshikimate 1-carboxyvinyltransferase
MSSNGGDLPSTLETALGPVDAQVRVPGSKSISNRALVCAALADGESHLSNVAPGDDTAAMIAALELLGISCLAEGSNVGIVGSGGRIRGGGVLDAGLAGTTSRFLTALCALADERTTITGGAPLRQRPMRDLHRALIDLGADVRHVQDVDHLPVEIRRGLITGGSIALRGDVSSQFVSALMMVGPYLDSGLTIRLESELVSRPYVDMTSHVMASFGVPGVEISQDRITVPAGRYAGCTYDIEPDASSASYPLACAVVTGGRVEVIGLTRASIQGDIRFLDILDQMGCQVSSTDRSTTVECSRAIDGLDIDMADVSDLVPTVAVLAMFATDPTRIRNVGFIRNKESDRLGDLASGIEMLGAHAHEHPDGLEVIPVDLLPDSHVAPSTSHDHRLAMAWSLVAMRRPGVTIDDPSVVNKSWPQWWEIREQIRRSSIR